jgi:single-strand DNA-binding protein
MFVGRSYNRVILVGNLTRDPSLKELPNGNKLCTFGVATDYGWKDSKGEFHSEAEIHQIVTWNKLAEICAKLLRTGTLVFIEGEIRTRVAQLEDGTEKSKKEIRANDMKILNEKTDVKIEKPEAKKTKSKKS